MADNLESLDNKALREKCIEYGLPNVPVTPSSRKVLIRRLRTSMGGGLSTATDNKKRRETIQVPTKITLPAEILTSDKDVKITPSRVNSRRTMAPASKYTEEQVAAERPRIITVETSLNTEKPVERNILTFKHSDQRDGLRPIRSETLNLGSRPSLSKTGVVTTSYSQDLAPTKQKIMETPMYTEKADDRQNSYQANSRASYLYGGIGSASKQTQQTFKQPEVFHVDKSRNYTSHFDGGSPPISSTLSQRTKRVYEEDTDQDEEDDDDDDDDDYVKTPYLSNFARNLERLKDEPIARLPQSIPTRIKRDQSWSSNSSPLQVNRRQTIERDEVNETFNQFLEALEHKYHLKRCFAIMAVALMAIFIYVFFVM